MINRRNVLVASGAAFAASLIPAPLWAGESRLIYLSPLQSNGELSSCQSEIWFAQDGEEMFVVTAADAWRARAVRGGLRKAQIWIGDVGMWQRSGGAYKDLPSVVATGAQVNAVDEHARLLKIMGKKYASEWGTWGPRFSKGLAEGSRVLLKYTPT